MPVILRIVSALLVSFLVAMLVFTGGCMTFRDTDAKVERYFAKEEQLVQIRRISFADRQIRAIETENIRQDSLPLIIFVHGAPGSAKDFQRYLADSVLLTKARMIVFDRPGYGYSGYGQSVTDIGQQAAAVGAIVSDVQPARLILVGHSYGGPIVGRYAMDYPNRASAIMMLAPVIDPESEKIFWYAGFAKWRATRWMLSKAWQVSGDEKFAHPGELQKMAAGWSRIDIPVVHLHGKRDKQLAPYGNVAFSEKRIRPDVLKLLVLEKSGHLIPFMDYDVVKEELLQLLQPELESLHN